MPIQVPASLAAPGQRLAHLFARFARPLTMGVRAAVLDDAGRVYLVRHSYVPGWHLPGGAVEPGETALEAMKRETREEANVEVLGRPALHGLFFNAKPSGRDHVAVYAVREFRVLGPKAPDWEIVESGFFPLDALPPGTTPATLARLDEIRAGAVPPERW